MILFLLVLASWRLTSIINRETAGKPIRKIFGEKFVNPGIYIVPDTLLGELYNCFWCLSVWCSLIVSILFLISPYLIYPFAISGAVIFIEEKVFNYGTNKYHNNDPSGSSSALSGN